MRRHSGFMGNSTSKEGRALGHEPKRRNAEHRLGTNRGPEFQRAEPELGVPTLRFMASMLVRLGRSKLPMNPNRRLTPALSSVRGAEVSKPN